MDRADREIVVVVMETEVKQIQELSDMQLALVGGGGGGETILH